MTKRIVSLLLCCIMICAIVPAFADLSNFIVLKSYKADSFYTLPEYLIKEASKTWVESYPAHQLDDVPLVRGGKLLIPANYEGLINVWFRIETSENSVSADGYRTSLTFLVRPATGPKLTAKIVDKKTIEVSWSKPFDDLYNFKDETNLNIRYDLNVYDADTGDLITYANFTVGMGPLSKRSSPVMTETGATIPLKGRSADDEKYEIKEGTHLKIEFKVYVSDGYARMRSAAVEEEGTLYTSSATKLSVPETPVIYKPVTNFNIGRKLDKRNAVGKTVTLVRGVKEKFRIFGVQPADATEPQFIWKSLNPNVVSVDNNGIITAKKLGTAVIKVKAVNTNVVKSFKIKVVRPADKK